MKIEELEETIEQLESIKENSKSSEDIKYLDMALKILEEIKDDGIYILNEWLE